MQVEVVSLDMAGHAKTLAIGQDALVTRNEVGLVCILLGEKLLAKAQCLLEPSYMETFLLAGILLEIENLNFASQRDTKMTMTLLVGSGSLGRNGFFNQLRRVENEERVSEFMTSMEMLNNPNVESYSLLLLNQRYKKKRTKSNSTRILYLPQAKTKLQHRRAEIISSFKEDSSCLKQHSSKPSKLHPCCGQVASASITFPYDTLILLTLQP